MATIANDPLAGKDAASAALTHTLPGAMGPPLAKVSVTRFEYLGGEVRWVS